ncbi:MAG TPA: dsRBD fold-containing protein [Acidimicrobiia bacterium]
MEKDISIDVHLTEDETETVVTAMLDIRGDHFEGRGSARRNPVDPPMPTIGEELAIARALGVLQAEVMEAAQRKISEFLAR